MALWVDKYRPTTFCKLNFHKQQAESLRNMVQKSDFPHLLVHGPPGAGKKTRIMAIIRELYGAAAERLRIEPMHFETASKKKLEIMTISSNFHIEVNPSDHGIYDRIVIMDLVKQTAQTQQFDINGCREFKVIILTNVDQLTKDAQHALRRTMEKYVGSCRLILCANSTSRILPAVKSRCLEIRVPAPTIDEIKSILHCVCRKEGLQLPENLATNVAHASGRNLRRAILMLEACKIELYPFVDDQKITEPDWQLFIRKTATMIVSEQSPRKLLEVRSRLYELLTHAIPSELIFKGLLEESLKNCDLTLKAEVIKIASDLEHRMRTGSKAIFHLEAFIARFMAVYKKFMDSTLAEFV